MLPRLSTGLDRQRQRLRYCRLYRLCRKHQWRLSQRLIRLLLRLQKLFPASMVQELDWATALRPRLSQQLLSPRRNLNRRPLKPRQVRQMG